MPRAIPHRCRTCDQPLSGYEIPEGAPLRWMHANIVDHQPDPIPDVEALGDPAGICDFCSSPVPKWCYFTDPDGPRDMVHDGMGFNDDGKWAACNKCHRLISQNRWEDLVDRAVHRIGASRGLGLSDANILRGDVTALHNYFRSVYIKTPQPIA